MVPLALSVTQTIAIIGAVGTFLSITAIPIVVQILKSRKQGDNSSVATQQPALPFMGMPTPNDVSLLIAQVREMQGQIIELQREVERLERENTWLKKMLEQDRIGGHKDRYPDLS